MLVLFLTKILSTSVSEPELRSMISSLKTELENSIQKSNNNLQKELDTRLTETSQRFNTTMNIMIDDLKTFVLNDTNKKINSVQQQLDSIKNQEFKVEKKEEFPIELMIEGTKCNQCCGCKGNKKCLFSMCTKINNYLDKNRDFEPLKAFQEGSGAFRILTMIIGDSGRDRCMKCLACLFINENLKLKLLFNLQDSSAGMNPILTTAMMGSGKMDNNLLAFLISGYNEKNLPRQSSCSTSGGNLCPIQSQQPTLNQPQGQSNCPSQGQFQCPSQTQPKEQSQFPTQQSDSKPRLMGSTATTQQSGYGITYGIPQNETSTKTYGAGYGISYN